MKKFLRRAMVSVGLLWLLGGTAAAQTLQFLPEVDAHLTLNSRWRTYLQAKDDQDAGAPKQLGIGPSIQLYLKPMIRLKEITRFDLDDAKQRAFVLEAGYRYVTDFDGPPTNRMQTIAYLNFPMKGGFLLSDRSRADLDWKNENFSWRYRNKLTVERTIAVRSYHLIPYAAVEPYYTSQYQKWSTTATYAGCLFPVGRFVELNAYYEHENNTGGKVPNQQNAIGFAAYFYSRLAMKR